jgi:hypothetical protein
MLIIESGKFFSDPAICMAEIVSFLGLKSYNFPKKELKRHYAGSGSGDWVAPIKYPPLARETRKLLRDFFAPYNDKLYALLGEDYGWR